MTRSSLVRTTLAVFAALLGVRVAIALLLPVTRDESYYLAWSKALDLGYLDHPPAVAWLGAVSALAPSSAFVGRLGALALAALTVPLCAGLYRRAGLTEPRALAAALLLGSFNVIGLTCGMLLLPDTPALFAWCLMLHEAAAALDGQPKRWLGAGFAAGLGMLSKYTLVLALPVCFIAALRAKPNALRTPWPWAGVALALLAFAPNLAWNAQHDWASFRFQLGHGLAGGHGEALAYASDLPAPSVEAGKAEAEPAPPEPRLQRALSGGGEFAGGQIALWGALLAPLAAAWFARKRAGASTANPLRPHLRPLLLAATLVPLAFFGAISLVSHVEGNWPGMWVVSAAALFAPWAVLRLRGLVVCAAINVLALAVLALHARAPLRADASDRIVGETGGYEELARALEPLDGPLFSTRHQTIGMLRFYLPGRAVAQWPGFTRPSEFVRRPEWAVPQRAELLERGSFWLVTTRAEPAQLEGFRPVERRELDVFVERGSFSSELFDLERPRGAAPARKPLVRWRITRYETAPATPPR